MNDFYKYYPADVEFLIIVANIHVHITDLLYKICGWKVSSEDAASELTGAGAGVILTCMANLRQCFLSTREGATHGFDLSLAFGQPGLIPGNLSASSLQVILKKLIEFIMTSST